MARDYKAEYRRRIERGLAQGRSRSQARGHARSQESLARPSRSGPDRRLDEALKLLRQTGSQTKAAKAVGISAERFRRFLRENKLAHREGRSWRITDNRPREISIISGKKVRVIRVNGLEPASLIGKYWNAVKLFLEKNTIDLLEPFRGLAVPDAQGREHVFETNPNTLYRLAQAGGDAFEFIYRLVV